MKQEVEFLFNLKVDGNMYFNRSIEKTFNEIKNQFAAVLLYGARQVGKSTMVLNNIDEKIDKVTFDDVNDLIFAKANPSSFLLMHPFPLFIDEVQKCYEIIDVIKMKIDDQKYKWLMNNEKYQLMYILSNSNQFELKDKVYDSLTGRVCLLKVNSFSYAEKMTAEEFYAFNPDIKFLKERANKSKLKPLSKSDIFNEIILGGMPELISQDLNREKYFASYVDTYIDKDIKNAISSKNILIFRLFLKYIALRTGQELNKTTISKEIGISVKTVEEWLNILKQSGIIFFIQPYMANISSRIIKAPKLYFYDTGLCSYLAGWNDARILENSPMSGAFYETYVVSEIIKSIEGQGKRWEETIFYYRDIDQKEIDLLYVDNNEITPIEIKKSILPYKENKNFNVLNKYHQKINPGIIIDSIDKITPLNENAYFYPVYLIGS